MKMRNNYWPEDTSDCDYYGDGSYISDANLGDILYNTKCCDSTLGLLFLPCGAFSSANKGLVLSMTNLLSD